MPVVFSLHCHYPRSDAFGQNLYLVMVSKCFFKNPNYTTFFSSNVKLVGEFFIFFILFFSYCIFFFFFVFSVHEIISTLFLPVLSNLLHLFFPFHLIFLEKSLFFLKHSLVCCFLFTLIIFGFFSLFSFKMSQEYCV